MFESILTPSMLIDRERVLRNIRRMQETCDRHGVELWPHVKTHKMVEVARMQLEAGARCLVCAKIGEAEAMLASGARRMFIAHSIVDPLNAPRLRALASRLDRLILAVTSLPQARALEQVLERAEIACDVMLAVDTGLGREGVRGIDGAEEAARYIRASGRMRLRGVYSHEGHAYGAVGETDSVARHVHEVLTAARERLGGNLPILPGCSVTAAMIAAMPGVTAVRPGTYVFGDLSLAAKHRVMEWDDLAATVLTTVVDRPDAQLALIDAGSKTLSGDKSAAGISGSVLDGRDIHVTRCSEEHGWATGADVGQLRIGDRVRLVPAHICPAINLADTVIVVSGGEVVDRWRVAARGKVQ
jgi:D-serine deaminase-like pyridoxal phosphate-dependent protein